MIHCILKCRHIVFFLLPIGIISEATNVDLAVNIPVTVSHFRVLSESVGLCDEELLAGQVFELDQFCQLKSLSRLTLNTPVLGPRLE